MKHRLLLGIDASRSTRSQPTGVERYSTEIIRALLKELGVKKDFELRLYTPKIIGEFPSSLQKILRFPRLWSLVRLSWEMLWHKPDLLFVPAHVLPFFAPRRSFVTLHDVAFEKIPEAYGWKQRLYLRWSTKRAVQKCEVIFVPSEAVREDLEQFFGARHVQVVPHGSLNLPDLKDVKRSSTPLFFFLGRLEAKKNLQTLAKAWPLVREQLGSARLVLAGSATPRFTLPELEGMERLGFVSEQDSSRLFHSATAFVFPSLEEGFGFPLLQAFSADCPVLCSDLPVLREVGGEAALYFEAKNAEALAEQMVRVALNADLRTKMAKKGRERLSLFSWEKTARQVVKAFKI